MGTENDRSWDEARVPQGFGNIEVPLRGRRVGGIAAGAEASRHAVAPWSTVQGPPDAARDPLSLTVMACLVRMRLRNRRYPRLMVSCA